MQTLLGDRRLPALVAVALVVFAFWRALIGGGSLVSHDIVATEAPFETHRSEQFALETGPSEPINIHAHWAALADDVRAGEFGWWNPDLHGGEPSFSAGVPVFDLAYLASPGWFAPGLVAAIRSIVAIGLMAGFLRSTGSGQLGALAGGIAFGFSGFLVGWMNWPQSSVAALAPGLLWAIEAAIRNPRMKAAVPVSLVTAAMVWSNHPRTTAYILLGALGYVMVRLGFLARAGGRRSIVRLVTVALVGAVLTLGIAAPHLLGSGEYQDWVDTSDQTQRAADSSAGPEYLLSAFAPSVWGADAVGAPWFGAGDWVEFNTHLGTSVVILALVGLGSGLVERDRRSTTIGLAVIGGLGVMIAYVGGPVGVGLDAVIGDHAGLMTHAKVLVAIAGAALAGLGVDRWAGRWEAGDRHQVRQGLRVAIVIGGISGLALVPSLRHWIDVARGQGAAGQSAATSAVAILSAGAVVIVGLARWKRWIRPSVSGWLLITAISFEVLFFAMPVPTTVTRAERLHSTPAHEVALSTLEPGERLGGEGRTFFPATTAQFGIDDARGQGLVPAGYQELVRTFDDISSPVWDSMAVGVWAQAPDQAPIGVVVKPPIGSAQLDGATEIFGSTRVPEGGLRAVVLDVALSQPTFVTVTIEVGGDIHVDRRWREQADWFFLPVALVGEHYPNGSLVELSVSADTEGALFVSADVDGRAVVGTIAGGDAYRLIRSGDVLLTERLTTQVVRSFGAATVEPDPSSAAALISGRGESGAPVAVVEQPIGLPADARSGTVLEFNRAPDQMNASVTSDTRHLVVFSVNNHPGWSASIDGERAEIVTAEASFIGVVVPAGEHNVEVTFRPRHLTLGFVFATAALLAVVVLWRGRFRLRSRMAPDR